MAAPLKHVCGLSYNTLFNRNVCRLHQRLFSCTTAKARAVVLGVYSEEPKSDKPVEMTPACKHFDRLSNGTISKYLSGKRLKTPGSFQIFFNIVPDYSTLVLCCLGPRNAGYDQLERLDVRRNNLRFAFQRALITRGAHGDETEYDIDPCYDAEVMAESAFLAGYGCSVNEKFYRKNSYNSVPLFPSLLMTDNFDRYSQTSIAQTHQDQQPYLELSRRRAQRHGSMQQQQWNRGKAMALAQNWARLLMDTPSNLMTPTIFANTVVDKFENTKVTVNVRDKAWIESEKMNAFLAVAQGSVEPPVFLHLEYNHPASKHSQPIALVGKGVTFDTGGISLKPSADMDAMKGDMGGAACVVAAFWAIQELGIPVNIHAFVPLTENMPGGKAIKPGDVVFARNGMSIQIDNTDAEGRLILADALNYAETFNPSMIMDLATLTGAIHVALGHSATGAFSTSDTLYDLLEKAGSVRGDRVWRMPLFSDYSSQVKGTITDLNNVGNVKGAGGSCTAAAFLKHFVTNDNWIHLDIAGVMKVHDKKTSRPGMSGRPTRTIVDFIGRVANMPDKIFKK